MDIVSYVAFFFFLHYNNCYGVVITTLYSHVAAIQDIVSCAQLELQLEEKFFSIEGKWTEETLHFKQYKSHGPALLDKDHTHSLLEQLEHAQIELATMLVSRHIQPLREEAIHWAAKLASVSDILQQVY